METYKKQLARSLAETGALFFGEGLVLKDGRSTPYFVNMAMFRTGRLCLELGSFFAGMMVSRGLVEKTDIILGPSYKGSAIALSTAVSLWKDYGYDLLFDYDRKEVKRHGEASVSGSMFVNRTFFDGCRIFVVDDVATSMGTKYDLLEKIAFQARAQDMQFDLVGIGIGIDREQTTAVYDDAGSLVPCQKGKDAIRDFSSNSGVPVYSVAGIKEVVEFLFKENFPVMIGDRRALIDATIKRQFDKYLDLYGIA